MVSNVTPSFRGTRPALASEGSIFTLPRYVKCTALRGYRRRLVSRDGMATEAINLAISRAAFTYYSRAKGFLCHIVCSPLFGHVAPLGVTKEVHMSDLSSNNDAWLSKLKSHMDTESYTAGTVSQYASPIRNPGNEGG